MSPATATVAAPDGLEELYAGSTREVFRRLLVELAREDRRIVCVDSDMGGLEETFGGEFPDRYFNVGIAEANMMGVAAGLAAGEKLPFVHAISSFAAVRACEQLKVDVAGNNLPVRVVVTHAGVSAGHYGPTHHALEDVAIVRALPNMTVIVPADGIETVAAVRAIVDRPGPVFVRLGRKATPLVHPEPYELRVGRAVRLRDGEDVTLVAAGPQPVLMALEARDELAGRGVSARVVNMHTIKPIDRDELLDAARTTRGIVTVEDHVVVGGLGGAVCEVVAGEHPCPVRRVGMPDRYCDAVGDERELLEHGGVTPGRIVAEAVSVWEAATG
jgi:transketolase